VTRNAQPILQGYPWEGKFQTMDEVRAYLDQTKVTCLLCGHKYKSLAKHLTGTHKIEADAYRERYGLPWTRSLAGKELRETHGRKLKSLRASGKVAQRPTPEQFKVLAEAAKRARPQVDVTRREAAILMRRLIEKRHGTVNTPEKMEEYLRRIETGRTITEVAKDEDMPSFQTFYEHCSKNPDFKRRLEEIWDQLPFGVQIRGTRAGPRLRKAMDELRRQGKTWRDLPEIDGVGESKAALMWQGFFRRDYERAGS